MSDWSNGVWLKLNSQPFKSLPSEEGVAAQKRFEAAANELHQKIRTKNLWNVHISTEDKMASGIRYPQASLDRYEKVYGNNSLGFGYDDNEGNFPPVYLSLGSRIRYKADCSDQEEELKEEFLPARIMGYFKIDWDGDGDRDLAVLLETGGYIFFRQEGCLQAAVHSSFCFISNFLF